MEIWIDSTDNARLDISMDYRVNEGTVKERRFVVTDKFGNKTSYESFFDAVEAYRKVL